MTPFDTKLHLRLRPSYYLPCPISSARCDLSRLETYSDMVLSFADGAGPACVAKDCHGVVSVVSSIGQDGANFVRLHLNKEYIELPSDPTVNEAAMAFALADLAGWRGARVDGEVPEKVTRVLFLGAHAFGCVEHNWRVIRGKTCRRAHPVYLYDENRLPVVVPMAPRSYVDYPFLKKLLEDKHKFQRSTLHRLYTQTQKLLAKCGK